MKMFLVVFAMAGSLAAATGQLKVRMSWGHQAAQTAPYAIKVVPGTTGVAIQDVSGRLLESGEGLQNGAWRGRAGGGDVDGIEFTLSWPQTAVKKLQNTHVIWTDLIAASDPDTARRLSEDPAFEPDSPKLTVFTNEEETAGFTVSSGQLMAAKQMWIPSLHFYISAGETPVSFEEHLNRIAARKGKRILDQVHNQPEASYEQYASLWEDMGSASYTHPNQPAPGHIVCLTWDSAIAKFGVDRGAGVWNDYGNPDRFRFWFDFGDLTKGIAQAWKGQHLETGLPVITTTLERDGVRYEVEQFAYPLNGPPAERRGDIPMVLLQKVRLTDLTGRARSIPVTMAHRRSFAAQVDSTIMAEQSGSSTRFVDEGKHRVLFSIEGAESVPEWRGVRDYQREREMKRVDATVTVALPAGGSRELVVKLPSPPVNPADANALAAVDYGAARKATLAFWNQWVNRGAQFRVPDERVNDLFRATLWHALRLPRRHGAEHARMDLPYSNFAYSQTGTPWPVNQAVYVDYMLFGLRGYFPVASEELRAQYTNNQEINGHVNGFANWLVYTPGMLYAVAQNYLLSHDRQSFDELLPQSLKALDYCLEEVRRAGARDGLARGLVSGPLNDGTGAGIWAFNQAYMYAGLNLFGKVLEETGNARAGEALSAARALREAIARAFGTASARSTLVELRDHTWSPYVPCEALTFRRILEQWYPTDVDTGAVHLLRLNALNPKGALADALLNDHEDNLFLKGLGMANEPVYNQQGTAYLLRDDPQAAIRTFYSYMASAFSHSVLEPVEHRWTHGQYFGPPSTDGAWFELYRNMLVRENEDGALWLAQATPRAWLEDGKSIVVERAPTWYGNVSMKIESNANARRITAEVTLSGPRRPQALVIRVRHPRAAAMRSVTVNGAAWKDFDASREWVRIPNPDRDAYSVAVNY